MSLGIPTLPSRDLVPIFTQFLHLSGLPRAPLNSELVAVEKFMTLPAIGVRGVLELAHAFDRHVFVRKEPLDYAQHDGYAAPKGSPDTIKQMDKILRLASHQGEKITPWSVHCRWMDLLPLSDKNLVIGLAIWAKMRCKADGKMPRDFMAEVYREALEAGR